MQHAESLLRAILDSIQDAVVTIEVGRVIFANHAFCVLTGYTYEELASVNLRRLISPNELTAEQNTFLVNFPMLLESLPNKTFRDQMVMYRKDGSSFYAAVTVTLIEHPTGEHPQRYVIAIRDVTEEKELEDQKSRFIANASHDLRSPLTTLCTRLYLLRKQPEKAEQHISLMELAAKRMTGLIDDLLDVTRFERGLFPIRRQETNVTSLVHEVVEMQRSEADKKSIRLQAWTPGEAVIASVDVNRLAQVVLNLVGNAISYTPHGGMVMVELRSNGKAVIITVHDTGVGIPHQHLHRVFEPFFRVNNETTVGTGLGLSITKAIIELHGGIITVDSSPGLGSTFTVTLPLRAAG
jgi:PAS domain S-box-containing protein